MADSSQSSNWSPMPDYSEAISIGAMIMIGAIIFLFLMVVVVFFVHLYIKWFRIGRVDSGTNRRRFVFTPSPRASRTTDGRLRRGVGLETSVIRSLPILVFNRNDFVDGLECAVCLCELSDGDKARLLPKCKHGFHVDCIDMWFHSHSTCPLCRNPVGPESSNPTSNLPQENIRISTAATDGSSTTESLGFPSNILFWGNQTQVSTGGSYTEDRASSSSSSSSYSSASSTLPPAVSRQGGGNLVVEIPQRLSETFSAMSPTAEEFRSPITTGMRSLKRLLSGKKRVIPCDPSSSVDVERGEGKGSDL